MIENRIPRALLDRLDNWGRAMRWPRDQGTSITGIICDSMANHAGQGALGKELTGSGPAVDQIDADFVEMVWRSLVLHMSSSKDHRRKVIKAHFVIRAHPGATCRALGIRHRDYDDVLVSATVEFGDRLAAWGRSADRTEEARAMV